MGEEEKREEKSERKVVSRRVAIGVVAVLLTCLVVSTICHLLVIRGMQYQIEYLQDEIDYLESKNAGLLGEKSDLQERLADLQYQVFSLQSQIDSLQSQVNELTKIVNLEKKRVFVDHAAVNQPASSYVYWEIPVDHAGYLVVTVHTSTTTNTYVQVVWSSHGVNYDETIRIGSSGTARFPVLPGTVEVRVGNTNIVNGATQTVTITYYY